MSITPEIMQTAVKVCLDALLEKLPTLTMNQSIIGLAYGSGSLSVESLVIEECKSRGMRICNYSNDVMTELSKTWIDGGGATIVRLGPILTTSDRIKGEADLARVICVSFSHTGGRHTLKFDVLKDRFGRRFQVESCIEPEAEPLTSEQISGDQGF